MTPSFLAKAAAGLCCLCLACGPAFAAEKADDSRCGKKVGAQGTPAPIRSVASLNAIQLWIELAEAQSGAESAMWHNASGALVKCEQIQTSSMYRCYATGKPCPPSAVMGASAKTN